MVTLEPSVKDEIVSRLKAVPGVRKIVLFGSHATGSANEDSDVDLWVETDSSASYHQRQVQMLSALRGMKLPIDVVALTPQESDTQWGVQGTLGFDVAREGVVLYEARRARGLNAEKQKDIVRTLAAVEGVRKIVLFGSHTRGEAGPDSDIDLWIEIETPLSFYARHAMIREKLYGISGPFDLYPVTPAEAEMQSRELNSITSEVMRSGVTLYDQQNS